jgi:hypothetical protein
MNGMKLGGPYFDVLYDDNFTCKFHRFDIGLHPTEIERAELMRCHEEQFLGRKRRKFCKGHKHEYLGMAGNICRNCEYVGIIHWKILKKYLKRKRLEK